MEDLSQLPNIGEVLAEKLSRNDITSYDDLVSLGSIEAVLRIGETDQSACYNMLYALEGAIRGIRWHSIPREERQQLKEEYDVAREVYERNVFFANMIIGVIVLVVALFLSIEAVSSGLMGGAVMLIVYGSMRYWGELSDAWRTLMLGVALVGLIWLGYKKLK